MQGAEIPGILIGTTGFEPAVVLYQWQSGHTVEHKWNTSSKEGCWTTSSTPFEIHWIADYVALVSGRVGGDSLGVLWVGEISTSTVIDWGYDNLCTVLPIKIEKRP